MRFSILAQAGARQTARPTVHSPFMTQPLPPDDRSTPSRFRRTLVRVMAVQVVALILLWLLQRHFSS